MGSQWQGNTQTCQRVTVYSSYIVSFAYKDLFLFLECSIKSIKDYEGKMKPECPQIKCRSWDVSERCVICSVETNDSFLQRIPDSFLQQIPDIFWTAPGQLLDIIIFPPFSECHHSSNKSQLFTSITSIERKHSTFVYNDKAFLSVYLIYA